MMSLGTHREPQTVKSKPPPLQGSQWLSLESIIVLSSEAALRACGSPSVPVKVAWADSPVLTTSPGSKEVGAPEARETGSVRSSEEHQENRFNKEGRTLIANQGHSEGEKQLFPLLFWKQSH